MQKIDISDFQWFDYSPGLAISHFPELTINADEVKFNAATLRKLGSPTSLKLMFDPKNKRFAIQGFSKKGNKTIDFPPERKSKDFGIFQKDKVKFIRNMMPEWDDTTRYKISGEYHEEENLIVYDLKTAKVFKGGIFPGPKLGKIIRH